MLFYQQTGREANSLFNARFDNRIVMSLFVNRSTALKYIGTTLHWTELVLITRLPRRKQPLHNNH